MRLTWATLQATRADFYGWQRIDYVLQEGGSQSGLLGHIRAIAQESCYRASLAVLTISVSHYCALAAPPSAVALLASGDFVTVLVVATEP